MQNSLRIPTQIGEDQVINFQIDQEFDFLEILSLKIQSEDVYTRSCADYGVVVGRITANGGFGLANVKVSIFVPIEQVDLTNQVISTLYPYSNPDSINEDGYRYNLLPYEKSYSAHVPTGTFPSRDDVLTNPTVAQIYDKYYKFTVKTNDSGDYMILGVPLGNQTVFMDLDLSDIGEFSLTPQDLIRMGRATETQLNGNRFKASPDLQTLPQIVSLQKQIEVSPLWGQPEICQIAINRVDFDLRKDASIDIQPTAVFMGSIVSASDNRVLRRNCRPATEGGDICGLTAGPGEILCIRQTIGQDINGRPVLETYEFDGGTSVIDENGTFLVDVPMNLDYVVTNEFGEKVISLNPRIGIPTKGKYRFKIKWQQTEDFSQQVKRAYYLVPNIREYGWTTSSDDPIDDPKTENSYKLLQKSYAFSLDWNDYGITGTTNNNIGNKMIDSAINCEDKFYEFSYNKIYTVSQFIDGFHNGANRGRFIGIKEIQDRGCDSENNKFPTNDAVKNFDLIFIVFNFLITFVSLLLIVLIPVVHIIAVVWPILRFVITLVVGVILWTIYAICLVLRAISFGAIQCKKPPSFKDIFNSIGNPFKNIPLPVITYPECELCNCEPTAVEDNPDVKTLAEQAIQATSFTQMADTPTAVFYENLYELAYCKADPYYSYATKDWTTEEQEAACADKTVSNGNVINQQIFQTLLAGSNRNVVGQRMGVTTWSDGSPRGMFDLTLSERLNQYNLKYQYFNEWGGWNQVQTFVATDIPGNNGKFHYDNTITILVDPATLGDFFTGRLVTFQNPEASFDPNTSQAQSNFSGFTSSTGFAKNLSSIVVNYADPNDSNKSLTQTYEVKQNPDAIEECKIGNVITTEDGEEWFFTDCDGVYRSGDTPVSGDFCVSNLYPNQGVSVSTRSCGVIKNLAYAKFKSDIEYFQVITGMTFSTFQNLNPAVNFTNFGRRTLYERYISGLNYIFQEVNSRGNTATWAKNAVFRPFYTIADYQEIGIVILQRGVDPNSTRQNTKVDISRICGQNYGTVVVESKYKLNIPIQPGLVLPRHDQIQTNETLSLNRPIFFDSYIFEPGLNYSGYNTNMVSHYSSLDSTKVRGLSSSPNGFQIDDEVSTSNLTTLKINIVPNNSGYVGADPGNNMIAQGDYSYLEDEVYRGNGPKTYWSVYGDYYLRVGEANGNRYGGHWYMGYYPNEYVEGGSYFYLDPGPSIEDNSTSMRFDRFEYFSPAYATTTITEMLPQTKKIVMRTDRLPTSSSRTGYKNNTYVLHQNANMSISFVSDEGDVLGYPNEGAVFTINEQTEVFSQFEEQYLSTFSCTGLVPLGCYSGDSESFGVYPKSNNCYEKVTVQGGCYIFVKKPLVTLIKDFKQVGEWKARIRINFAACRGVFGHSFINNWVSGVLYHFPFRNVRYFTSPTSPNPNQPFNVFCNSVIVFHDDTNNFYYRSSPYSNTGSFIGKGRTGRATRNEKEILFPTTILNLGPRDAFSNELSLSADFFGYNMENIPTTSFQDVSEILNLFIISRQINSTWLENILGVKEGSINQFFSRNKSKVDGDYAQMISINSEVGVQAFNFDAYTAVSGTTANNPFYVGMDSNTKKPVMGIFFSGSNQIRDYVSPRRIIRDESFDWNSTDNLFDYLGTKSQQVPFYAWETKKGSSIFGTEENDWKTNTIQSADFQTLDRLNPNSNYFMGQNPRAEFMKGYIYNRNLKLVGAEFEFEGDKIDPYVTPTTQLYFTVGLPYHFYFGLKVGASAINRFYKKYIG